MRLLPFKLLIGVALMLLGLCDSPAVSRAPAPSDLALGSGEVGDRVYVPRDVEDAIAVLQRTLPPAALKEIRAGSDDAVIAKYHFGLGMGLRNDWGLWRGSRLAHYFATHGVTHPDEMSSIVLLSLYRRLHGQPLRLDEQFREAKAAEKAAVEAPLPPLPRVRPRDRSSAQPGAEVDAGLRILSPAEITRSAPHHLALALDSVPDRVASFMYRAEVARALAAYASGDLSREDLAACVATVYTDDALFPDKGTEDEPWRSADDEASLLLWLVHMADTSLEPETAGRRTVSRALACYHAVGAEETLVLMRLIFDQDRLCDVLAKVERGVISRTGFLNVLSNTRYDPSIKQWLAETTPEGLQYLRWLLLEESYGEVVRVLRA